MRAVDLLVTGGTVVNASGSRLADVAVDGGRIVAVEPDLAGLAATARERVDATGLLVLPGCIDVHTHTRVASDARPDRFFTDSVAAAHGGTTTFLSFNNPGTGSSPAAERSLLTGIREWRAATEHDSAIDYGLSLAISGRADDALAEIPAYHRCRAWRRRRRSWSSTSGCRMIGCSRRCGRWPATAGCSRSTARTRCCSTRGSARRLTVVTCYRATTLLRDQATSRPWRPPGRWPSRGWPRHPSTSSTCHRLRPSTKSGGPRRPGSASRPRPARTTWS